MWVTGKQDFKEFWCGHPYRKIILILYFCKILPNLSCGWLLISAFISSELSFFLLYSWILVSLGSLVSLKIKVGLSSVLIEPVGGWPSGWRLSKVCLCCSCGPGSQESVYPPWNSLGYLACLKFKLDTLLKAHFYSQWLTLSGLQPYLPSAQRLSVKVDFALIKTLFISYTVRGIICFHSSILSFRVPIFLVR